MRRKLWKYYYTGTDGIVFVVDSNDRKRMTYHDPLEANVHDELQKIVAEPELDGVPILFLANKQDLPNAMTITEMTEKLKLRSMRSRDWFIQSACGVSGDGIYEGLDWLAGRVNKRVRQHR
jgi:ADP-ribosylation factor 1/2